MFKLGAKDYSNRVLAGAYAVQSKDVYNTWTDCNYVEHRDKVRERIEGSFDVLFLTIEEYTAFMADLLLVKQSDTSYLVNIMDNAKNIERNAYVFLDMTPVRDRKPDWSDVMQAFTISVKER